MLAKENKNVVVKRSGEIQEYDQNKIIKMLTWATEGLDAEIDVILAHFSVLYTNNQTTTVAIHKNLVSAAMDQVSIETPDYEIVAGRLYNLALRKEVWGGINPPRLLDLIKSNVEKGFYTPELLEKYSDCEINKINEFIKHDLDFELPYSAINQIEAKYLVQDRKTGQRLETPQFAYVLVAMTIMMGEDKKRRFKLIKKAYEKFSQRKINLATPVFGKARTKEKSFASCCLLEVDDTSSSIMASTSLMHFATVNSYGLGVNVSKIRPKGSKIRGGTVIHTGLQPYLKQFESVVAACHQNGIRGGAGTIFINWWHSEILDVLALKDNMLPDNQAVRGLDYALVTSRLLWDRIANKEDITLFNPNEVKHLIEAFGSEDFDDLYLLAEKNPDLEKKTIKATTLMSVFLKQRGATGRIYLFDIDNANEQSPFKERVKQSNLCVTGSQWALTSNGFERVRDLYEDGNELVLFDGEKKVSASPMKLVEKNADVYVVKLKNGLEHEITSYHKLVKLEGSTKKQTECKNLTVGDFVEIQGKSSGFDYDISSAQEECFELKLPILLDKEPLDTINKFDHKNEGGSIFVEIESITYKGKEDVYCTTVDSEDHLWVCNGFITSNCLEITQPTKPCSHQNDPNGLIGVCILSAINPLAIKDEKDWEETLEVAVRFLDNLIDYQNYFDLAAENFAKKYRSLGIGMFNFAAYLAEKKIKFNSEEAVREAGIVAEKLSYYAIKASIKLAKERGKFEFFEKTKWSDGELPIDRYNNYIDSKLDNLHLDWEYLRSELKTHGIRNSTLIAYMPVESSSIATGCTSGIEPIKSPIVLKSSRVNSVTQLAPNLKKNKDFYVSAYDIKNNNLLSDIYLAFNKFTCMSISMNHFVSKEDYDGSIPLSVLMKDMFYFVKNGGITMYYLNTDDNASSKDDFGCTSGGCKL